MHSPYRANSNTYYPPPNLIVRELRSFDVPMMVFLSGVSFSMSCGRSSNYWTYIKKRFVRLILPTWIFLLFYHIIIFIVHPDFNVIIGFVTSLFMKTGWYTWIMRLFFFIALMSPLVIWINRKTSKIQYMILLLFFLVINEYIENIINADGENSNILVIAWMNMPFLMIFSIGSRINRLKSSYIINVAVLAIFAYVLCAVYYYTQEGQYVELGSKKYPPHFYYITYGIGMIFILWIIRKSLLNLFENLKVLPLITFIGRHTMWIYFWHIIFLDRVTNIHSATLRFSIVIIGAVFLTWIQSLTISKVSASMNNPDKIKLMKTVFNG